MNELLSQEKKRYIHIKREDREFIMKAFKVTERTVFNAIRFDGKRGNTDLANRIRKLAMERGCIVMVVVPEVEPLFDADGYMRQYFSNGVLLEISKNDGSGDLYFESGRMWHTDCVMWSEIDGIQERARALK